MDLISEVLDETERFLFMIESCRLQETSRKHKQVEEFESEQIKEKKEQSASKKLKFEALTNIQKDEINLNKSILNMINQTSKKEEMLINMMCLTMINMNGNNNPIITNMMLNMLSSGMNLQSNIPTPNPPNSTNAPNQNIMINILSSGMNLQSNIHLPQIPMNSNGTISNRLNITNNQIIPNNPRN